MKTTLQQHRTAGQHRKHRTSRLALRALLALLLVSVGTEASAGWQLCLGAEGHVEIERRGACDETDEDPARAPDADECDPCRDILIGVDSDDALLADRPTVRPLTTDAMAARASATTADSASILHSESLFSEVREDAGLHARIRTVVLLI